MSDHLHEPETNARSREGTHSRGRTVACVILHVPVALGFALGAFVVAEAIFGGPDLRVAKIAMGVTAMLGTGTLAVTAFMARSVTLSIIALLATPVVLFIARLVGFGASEW